MAEIGYYGLQAKGKAIGGGRPEGNTLGRVIANECSWEGYSVTDQRLHGPPQEHVHSSGYKYTSSWDSLLLFPEVIECLIAAEVTDY